MGLIVTLREEARLPVRAIQWYLRTAHQLELSVGGIVDLCHRVADKGKGLVEEIRDRIRASPVVHADETGWREVSLGDSPLARWQERLSESRRRRLPGPSARLASATLCGAAGVEQWLRPIWYETAQPCRHGDSPMARSSSTRP